MDNFSSTFEYSQQLKRRYFAETIPEQLDPSSEERRQLHKIIGLLNIHDPPQFESHRPILGTLIRGLKNCFFRLIWPVVRASLRKQSLLNHQIWVLQRNLKLLQKEVESLKAERKDFNAKS
jgi:hypothetical protein